MVKITELGRIERISISMSLACSVVLKYGRIRNGQFRKEGSQVQEHLQMQTFMK
jgi:hypothetical protein